MLQDKASDLMQAGSDLSSLGPSPTRLPSEGQSTERCVPPSAQHLSLAPAPLTHQTEVNS